MASLADSLTAEQKRNIARLVGDPGWIALGELADAYRMMKVQWATQVLFTADGIDEKERNYWRGYLAALEVFQKWPGEIAGIIEREAQSSE